MIARCRGGGGGGVLQYVRLDGPTNMSVEHRHPLIRTTREGRGSLFPFLNRHWHATGTSTLKGRTKTRVGVGVGVGVRVSNLPGQVLIHVHISHLNGGIRRCLCTYAGTISIIYRSARILVPVSRIGIQSSLTITLKGRSESRSQYTCIVTESQERIHIHIHICKSTTWRYGGSVTSDEGRGNLL